MRKFDSEFDIVGLAWQIIEMDRRIHGQACEIERLQDIEKKYSDLLDSSISHGKAMISNILQLCITPGVLDACVAAKENEDVQYR